MINNINAFLIGFFLTLGVAFLIADFIQNKCILNMCFN